MGFFQVLAIYLRNHFWFQFRNNKIINILHAFRVSDLSKVFKFKYVHLGGDEVNTGKLNVTKTIYVFQ